MSRPLLSKLARRALPVLGLAALVVAMNGAWATAQPAPTPAPRARPGTATTATSTTTSAAPAAGASNAPAPPADLADAPTRPGPKRVAGKLNLNTATEEQLMLLPSVGPSKAERIVAWRKKNGGFKRPADLRRVKGFGYKTFKRLEPFLDVTGESTLAIKR